MKRAEVIDRLRALEPEIRGQGVSALYLYGSHARDEARDDSDIDILVDFANGRGAGFLEFMRPYELLESAFQGVEIGYGTRDSLAAPYRIHVARDAVRIF